MDHNLPLPVPCSLAFRTSASLCLPSSALYFLAPVFKVIERIWTQLVLKLCQNLSSVYILLPCIIWRVIYSRYIISIITGQFFFFTNLFISVWSSLPLFLCSDDSLNPLCLHLSSMHLWFQQFTGNMSLKSEVKEAHVVIGVHHFYLVPVPNLTRFISTAFSFPYFL